MQDEETLREQYKTEVDTILDAPSTHDKRLDATCKLWTVADAVADMTNSGIQRQVAEAIVLSTTSVSESAISECTGLTPSEAREQLTGD